MPGGKLIALVVVAAIRTNDGSKKNSERTAKFSALRSNSEGVQRQVGVVVDRFSDGAPAFLEMRITCPQHDAAAEAVEPLITGKCLVSRVVNENEQVIGPGFQFFVEGRFQAGRHRPSADAHPAETFKTLSVRLSLIVSTSSEVMSTRGSVDPNLE